MDVTAPIDPATTPIYPGDAPIKLDFLQHLDKGGRLTLSAFSFGAHTGTHVDAPMHFIKGGEPLDKLPLERFMGAVRVIDCSPGAGCRHPGVEQACMARRTTGVLFRTRNSHNGWMTDPVFHKDFTYLAPDAAKLLADAGVELVGVDYISAEKFGAEQPLTHRALLGKAIMEGLDLRSVKGGEYDLIFLPIRIVGHEAAPSRALLKPR